MKFKLIDNHYINLRSLFPQKVSLVSLSFLFSAIILLCLACDNAERTTQIITAPEEGAEQLPPGEGLDIGAIAPDFALPDSEGNTHNLSQYLGQTLVIVFYRTGT